MHGVADNECSDVVLRWNKWLILYAMPRGSTSSEILRRFILQFSFMFSRNFVLDRDDAAKQQVTSTSSYS